MSIHTLYTNEYNSKFLYEKLPNPPTDPSDDRIRLLDLDCLGRCDDICYIERRWEVKANYLLQILYILDIEYEYIKVPL